jgi:hypothetical protein
MTMFVIRIPVREPAPMSWDLLFPNAIADDGAASHLEAETLRADILMDSEAFAAFYSRSARSLWAYPNSAESSVLQGGDVERGERSSPCATSFSRERKPEFLHLNTKFVQ